MPVTRLTRRDLLLGATSLGAAAFARQIMPIAGTASLPSTPVSFDVPPHACDCHIHIVGDPARYPFFTGRVYTPELASVLEARALHRALNTPRTVVIQPSFYGTDNSCML